MSETRNMQLQNKRHERRLDGKSPNDKVLTQEVLNFQSDPDSFRTDTKPSEGIWSKKT